MPASCPNCLLCLLCCGQVKKLVYVKDLQDITSRPYVARELMLIKVGGVHNCQAAHTPVTLNSKTSTHVDLKSAGSGG